MYRIGSLTILKQLSAKAIGRGSRGILQTLGLGVGLLAVSITPLAHAASPVTYSLNPSSGTYQSGATVAFDLSVSTTVALAGVSVHVGYDNGSFAGFEAAATSGLMFVSYHEDVHDLVIICSDNNCDPGTYIAGKLFVKAADTGNLTVTLTPKETLDPNLEPIAADTFEASYTRTSAPPSVPATTAPPKKTTSTIPGNDNSTTQTSQVSQDELETQEAVAQEQLEDGTTDDTEPEGLTADGETKLLTGSRSSFPWLVVGIVMVIPAVLFAGYLLIIWRRRRKVPAFTGYTPSSVTDNSPSDIIRPDQFPPDQH